MLAGAITPDLIRNPFIESKLGGKISTGLKCLQCIWLLSFGIGAPHRGAAVCIVHVYWEHMRLKQRHMTQQTPTHPALFGSAPFLCSRSCPGFNSLHSSTHRQPRSLRLKLVALWEKKKKMEHYQKFLTKQFLKKDLAARIVKLKGTVSLKSSCTSQGSLCNFGNSFQKKLGHGNGRGTWAV